MFRYSFVIALGLCSYGAASAATWADSMFEELSKDFGSVPHGPTQTHSFHLTNRTKQTVHIAGVSVSCGCVSASALQTELAPGQSTAVVAQMDTRRFSGTRAVTIFVEFDQPRREEVQLRVQANSRDDVTITPESLAFGRTKQGSSPRASVTVAFLGNGELKITKARCESNYVLTTLKELRRDDKEVSYRLTARIRPDIPVGKWYTDLWLTTDNATTPRVRVPLTVEIEAPLSVSPDGVVLGQVKAGGQAERRVIVRGSKAFRIVSIKGTDKLLSVRDSTTASKHVHVLTVTVKSPKAGEFSRPIDVDRTISIVTDIAEGGQMDFKAKARILP
ncbi:MAG TPA: DUF1573 domain-containing protein [Gemmataceae bacterium]|jgi:hypothetical protein|nr:DUF1573 domain-containing protein [Gemmataceae bacterium]